MRWLEGAKEGYVSKKSGGQGDSAKRKECDNVERERGMCTRREKIWTIYGVLFLG